MHLSLKKEYEATNQAFLLSAALRCANLCVLAMFRFFGCQISLCVILGNYANTQQVRISQAKGASLLGPEQDPEHPVAPGNV